MSQQVQVTIPQILGYLDNGMSRKEIAAELGITMQDCKRMFQHVQLKGKQAKQIPGFIIVEPTTEAVANAIDDQPFAHAGVGSGEEEED